MPDYDLEDLRIVSDPQVLKALFHPLRGTLLELTLERAASVAELAEAVERPKSSVAYHVGILADADLLRVVRTRRVRAVEERFYGRTAKIYYVGPDVPLEHLDTMGNDLVAAAAESGPAFAADRMRALTRHAKIPRERAAEFWDRVFALTREFSEIPRTGEEVYAFVVALYPTDYPTLPEPGVTTDDVAAGPPPAPAR